MEDYLLPIERIQSSAWKDTVMADGYPHWFSDNNSDVFLAQKIVNLRGENRPNILYLKPDSKALFQPLLDIADEDFGFYILENDTGNILFKKSSANLKSLGIEDILRFQNNTKEAQKAGVSVLSVPLQAQPVDNFILSGYPHRVRICGKNGLVLYGNDYGDALALYFYLLAFYG